MHAHAYYKCNVRHIIIDNIENIFIILQIKQDKKWYDVGEITLNKMFDVKTKSWFYETHSNILPEFQGQGFGIYLYSLAAEEAEEKKIPIMSSCRPSIMAQRLWRSKRLRNYFNIQIVGRGRGRRFLLQNKKAA